ncbi:MAG: NAD(P)H-hydrate epimerase, partial [Spirochaetaceae bacterium]|nr:NAD(P)H-hydrate epimerase [Spirochaetaceae bacterium]
MRDLVACAEAARLDAAVRERAALSAALLMEDASLRLWMALEPIAASLGAGRDSELVVLCGPGNNGGDALALLRHARFSGLVRLAAVVGRARPGELPALHAASIRALGLPVLSWEEEREDCEALIARAGLLVDGIAGTGLSGPLREPLASLLRAANASSSPRAAIDLPSGLYDGHRGKLAAGGKRAAGGKLAVG